MPDNNRISATLSDQDVTDIQAAIATIRQKMPFLLSLSDEERHDLPKLGDRTVAFHDKVGGYMESDPAFTPAYLDPAERAKDEALRLQLAKVVPDLQNLARQSEDTVMELGRELLQGDLAYYNNVRQAVRQGAPNAQTIYNDLKTRFPGRGGAGGSNAGSGGGKTS